MMAYHELEHNNHLYRELLLKQSPMISMDVVDVSLNELNGRISDLKTIKDVILSEEGDASKNQKLREFVSNIKMKRHENIFKDSDGVLRSEIMENNKRWRHEIVVCIYCMFVCSFLYALIGLNDSIIFIVKQKKIYSKRSNKSRH